MTAAAAEAETQASSRPSQLPLFEGQRVTDHEVNFSGSNEITELELVPELRLNKDVELVVRGRVASRTHRVVRDKAGNVVKTVSVANIAIESISSYDEG